MNSFVTIEMVFVDSLFHTVNCLLVYLIMKLLIIQYFIWVVITLLKLLGESIQKNINFLPHRIMKWEYFYHQKKIQRISKRIF